MADISVVMLFQVGAPAQPGKRVTRAEAGIPDGFRIHIDVGGEGRLDSCGLVTGFSEAINLHLNVNRHTSAISPAKDIPNLVQVSPWTLDPSFPFADNFADRITMIASSLTDKTVEEMARVIAHNGIFDFWMHRKFDEQINKLAQLVNGAVQFPPGDDAFSKNGWEVVHKRIVARKG